MDIPTLKDHDQVSPVGKNTANIVIGITGGILATGGAELLKTSTIELVTYAFEKAHQLGASGPDITPLSNAEIYLKLGNVIYLVLAFMWGYFGGNAYAKEIKKYQRLQDYVSRDAKD